MVNGGLSTAEKLASLNPAQRREGQSELSQQSSSQQTQTVSRARGISTSGATGVVTESKVVTETQAIVEVTKEAEKLTGEETAGDIVRTARPLSKRLGLTEASTIGFLSGQAVNLQREKESEMQGPEVQRAEPTEVRTGFTGGIAESIDQDQEVIKEEKAERLGLFGGRKLDIGGELIKKFKSLDLKGKFEKELGQPLVMPGEIFEKKFPKITRFAETTVAIAGTVVVLKQLPPSVVIPIESAFVGTFATQKAAQFKVQPLKQFALETTLEVGALALGGRIGAGGKPGFIKSEVVEVTTPRGTETFKVTGLEVAGKGLPLATRTKTGLELGLPKVERIKLTELVKDVPAPETTIGGKLRERVLDFTPKEKIREASFKQAATVLKGEKGLKVKEAIFETGLLKKPIESSKIIETFAAKEKAVLFGSQTTRQLPRRFRSTTKASDIDVVIEGKTAAQGTPGISRLAKELRFIGEEVRVSKKKPTIIETTKGEKLLEFKFTGEPIVSGEPVAKGGVLGFRFADIKKGQIIKGTVPFGTGGLRAERAGTQFLRKGAGSLFATKEGLFAPQRRLKDVGGLILSGRGLVEVRKGKLFVSGRRTRRAETAIETFVETLKPEEKKLLELELGKIREGRIRLEPSVTPTKLKTPSLKLPTPIKLTSPSISKVISPRPSPRISPRPSPRVSPRISPRVSPRLSPRISPKISPAISKIVSPRPSPSISPKIVSPRISPRISPSPRLSPRPSTRPSPRFSPISPSLFKAINIPPPTRKTLIPGINLNLQDEKLFPKGQRKRQFQFTPSLVALEGKISGARPSVLTGIEIRKITG